MRSTDMKTPQLSQPLCAALQMALVELLRVFGIVPDVVVGHSSGEIAAAYAVGGLSFESACKVAYHRGRLCGSISKPGSMISVNLAEDLVQGYLDKVMTHSSGDIHIACINSPSNVTLSGNHDSIDELQRHLEMDGIFSRKLNTDVAYHSPSMQQIADEYESCLGSLNQGGQGTSNNMIMVSSVTGDRVSGHRLCESGYWVDNLVSPVIFMHALHYIQNSSSRADGLKPVSVYLEVGPHGALRRPVSDTLSASTTGFEYIPSLSKFEQPRKTMLDAAGRLFAHGYPLSVSAVNQDVEASRPVLADLPGYPFDHSQSYWYETRRSREWRLRKKAHTSLLGARATDWNPLLPQWRKVLSLEDTPWIADHVVGDVPFFPAAGMLMMALEAVKETAAAANDDRVVSGYIIKDALFSSPIVVRPGSRVEVVTHLRPLQQSYEKESGRVEISISALVDDYWNQCFRATVMSETRTPNGAPTEIDGGREMREISRAIRDGYDQAKAVCQQPVEKHSFYKWQLEQGLKYGDAFSLVDEIFWDGKSQGIAGIDVRRVEKFDGLVHPAVLDACFQVCSVSPSGGMSTSLPTCIPHKMQEAWISASEWPVKNQKTANLQVWSKSKLISGAAGLEATIAVLASDGRPLCRIKGFNMVPITANNKSADASFRKIFSRVVWKPQLSLLSSSQLQRYCTSCLEVDGPISDDKRFKKRTIEYGHIAKALRNVLRYHVQELKETRLTGATPELQRYLSWAAEQAEKAPESGVVQTNGDAATELRLLQDQESFWGFHLDVARNFSAVVSGRVDACNTFLTASSPHGDDFWSDLSRPVFTTELITFFRLSVHESAAQSILHIGAGPDGLVNQVLSTLRLIEEQTGGLAYCDYVYTDSTEVFLDYSRRHLESYDKENRVVFKKFDVDKDIASQELGIKIFDIILIKGDVLHTSKDTGMVIQNLARVLKPGGRLVIVDQLLSDAAKFLQTFGLGVVPGWWTSRGACSDGLPASLGEPKWDALLNGNGFSGNDLVLRTPDNQGLVVVSTVTSSAAHDQQVSPLGSDSLVIVASDNPSHYEKELLATAHLQHFSTLTMAQLETNNHTVLGKEILFLADMDGTFLAHMSEHLLLSLQALVQNAKSLLWVTLSNLNDTARPPYSALKDGLLRTIRTENSGKRIVSLSLESVQSTSEAAVSICRVLSTSSGTMAASEFEYIARDGLLFTGRLYSDLTLDDESMLRNGRVKMGALSSGPPLQLEIQNPGSLDSLRLKEDSTYHQLPIGDHEIEIEARAWGLNFRDVFIALGRLPDELVDGLGGDCAGIVTRVGSKCSDKIEVGHRVFMMAIGCMRTHPRASELATVRIPEDLSFSDACAVIAPGLTAWRSLAEVARLQEGEKVLIHAASGATGQLSVQIARHLGAEVFATVGYDYKKQLLLDSYVHDKTIAEDHVLYSRDTTFSKGIMRLTDGNGVDVVLNSLVGEGLRQSWECIAPYGRFVEIGKADIHANSNLPMRHFAKNVSFSAVDLRHHMLSRPDLGSKLLQDVVELMNSGRIYAPTPVHKYRVSDVEDAFRYFQSGKNTGRVIIEIDPCAEVKVRVTLHR